MSVDYTSLVRRLSPIGHPDTSSGATAKRTDVPSGSFVWDRKPIRHALEESACLRERPPGGDETLDVAELERKAFCTEVGRRLLLSEYLFHEWVLRRVEKVAFANERRISRHISVELRVPDEAPVILDDNEEPHWLIPLSVMRRRTLVNLDLRDEENRSVSMLGLRFTQRLDESLLRAAAVLAVRATAIPPDLVGFIHRVVSGEWTKVREAEQELKDMRQRKDLERYLHDPLFEATLDRMWHNFTLYVTLPVARGRHRLIRMSFDEPVDWGYQKGSLTPADTPGPEVLRYRPFGHRLPGCKVGARLGWTATRMRFLIPSAENCASYHFEFTAPPGVRVSRARLVAGRPNRASEPEHARKVSVDGVDAPGELVGLHAVEIPNGSLCRAQVELRIPARGWLITLFFICLSIVVVTGMLTWYLDDNWPDGPGKAQSLFLSLVTLSAGATTYVVHHDSREVAARMQSWLRGAGLVVISAPVVMGIMLLVLQQPGAADESADVTRYFVWPVAVACGALALIMTALLSLFGSSVAHWWHPRQSPWDMAHVADGGRKKVRPIASPKLSTYDYPPLAAKMRMSKRSIGVASAEGWHETYAWDAQKQERAVATLRGPLGPPRNVTRCTCDQSGHHLPTH